jgi:arsenate reductase
VTRAPSRPTVLFVCVHNAGRSQMAAGWLAHLAGDRVDIRSAGSEPADRINPRAVEAMAEVGIDITAAQPALLTSADVAGSDVVVTMGCGDACPWFPGTRYEDWQLTDPAGQPLEGRPRRPRRDPLPRRTADRHARVRFGTAARAMGRPRRQLLVRVAAPR